MASPSIRYMLDGDIFATRVPSTTAGLQAAIDALAGGKGKVFIGPGTLEIDNEISLHSGCYLQGSGPGVTVIKRATGSFNGSSPNYHANMLISTAIGSNGTLSGSGDPQSEITVADLTIDGNASAFAAVVFSDLAIGHYGIKFQYVDGVVLSNLEIKNLLQTGVDLVSCANCRVSNIRFYRCGQYASAASRNSINFNNGSTTALANGYARGLVLNNMVSKDSVDTHITLKNVMDVDMSNLHLDGAKIGIEIESTDSTIPLQGNFTISNVTAQNQIMNFLRFSPRAGTGIENVSVSNCVCNLHPTLHGSDTATAHSAALFFGRTNDAYFKGLSVENVVCRNINSASANTECSMLLFGLPGTTQSSDVTFKNIRLYGANGTEANSVNRGFDITGNVRDLRIIDCHVFDVEDRGFYLSPGATSTIKDVMVRGCSVDGGQFDGFGIIVQNNGGTIARVDVADCVSKDCAKGQSSRGFLIGSSATTAGSTCNDVMVRGCRVAQTSGAINGIEVFQSTSSVVDNIVLAGNDVSDIGAAVTPYKLTGAPTNVHITYPHLKTANITAATTITLLPGSFSSISGATTIDNITNNVLFAGREITLQTSSNPTIRHNGGGTGNIRCSGAADLVMSANDIVKFVSDGTLWWQSSNVVVI